MSRLIDQVGLTAGVGLTDRAGLYKFGTFDPLALNPYAFFDGESYKGTLENPTLDLDPSNPDSLDVITATRSGSTATFTDSSGLIQAASPDTVRVDYTQGAELTPTKFQRVGYTDFSSGWATYLGTATLGDGYDSQASLVCSFTGTGQSYQEFQSVDGRTYTGSVWARAVSASGPYRLFHGNSASGLSTYINLTSEWQFFSVQFLGRSGGGTMYFGIGAQNGDSVEISQPQVEEGTTASSFVENTTGSPKFTGISATYAPRVPMILCEPSAINLLPYSEDFSNSAWNKNNVTLTADYGIAPDGTNTSTRIEYSGTSYMQDSFAVSDYTVSAFVKGVAGQVVRFGIGANVAGGADFTLSGEWQRIEYTGSGGTIFFSTFGGNTATDFEIWGAQVETGSVATSYIPTAGGDAAARTRAADDLEITGSAFTDFYNQSEGTFYSEFLYDHDETSNYVYSVTETGANEVRSQILASSLRTRYTVNSSHLANLENSGILKGSLNRAAFSYKTNNFRANLNGGSDDEELSGTASINPIKLTIGSRSAANYTNGHIKRLLFWPYSSENL